MWDAAYAGQNAAKPRIARECGTYTARSKLCLRWQDISPSLWDLHRANDATLSLKNCSGN